MTGTAQEMIAEARKSLGMKESPAGSNHNAITVWYNDHVAEIGDGPWCDMSITMWGWKSGSAGVVGKFAYTVWHAQWFQRRGDWHFGTGGIRAGDVLFFDWGRTKNIGAIDHVGLVERVEGGKIYTIEGNSGDVCKRMVRDSTYVVGYGRPDYAAPAVVAPSGSPMLVKGIEGDRVRALQRALNKAFSADLDVDGKYGALTKRAVLEFQTKHKLEKDGKYGTETARALKSALAKLK